MVEDFGFEEHDADVLSESLDGTNNLIAKATEIIKKSHAIQSLNYRWKMINGADAIHAVLAERIGASYLTTSDEGFKGMENEVKPLIIQERY